MNSTTNTDEHMKLMISIVFASFVFIGYDIKLMNMMLMVMIKYIKVLKMINCGVWLCSSRNINLSLLCKSGLRLEYMFVFVSVNADGTGK
jgi:hypothetical protein